MIVDIIWFESMVPTYDSDHPDNEVRVQGDEYHTHQYPTFFIQFFSLKKMSTTRTYDSNHPDHEIRVQGDEYHTHEYHTFFIHCFNLKN